ncbi:hypothetical protein Zmor_001387 [Zophobas morio]|uniref:Uncharacterized protein n=1 Tax=Zophobas morio TaxID=2755281 RepID=A0AA38IZ19_9CUCU|nr:hypothetical protein Zmor_001387 [Zophobas morio]
MSFDMPCSKCNKKCSETEGTVCDLCHHPIHFNCGGITKAEKACLQNKNRRIQYFCDRSNLSSVIDGLKDEIASLKAEVKELKNIHSNKSNPEFGKNHQLSQDELLEEIEDRHNRSCNVILYNLKESDKETGALRKEDDVIRCKELLFSNTHDDDITYI